MKLILLQDVKGLGKSGQVVEASDGYARNYLLPRQIAQHATDGALKQVAQRLKTEKVKAARLKAEAEELGQKLDAARITITHRAGTEGRLYGAVTAKEIAEAVHEQTGLSVDKRKLDVHEPIKHLGEFEIHAKIHPEVSVTLHVTIAGE